MNSERQKGLNKIRGLFAISVGVGSSPSEKENAKSLIAKLRSKYSVEDREYLSITYDLRRDSYNRLYRETLKNMGIDPDRDGYKKPKESKPKTEYSFADEMDDLMKEYAASESEFIRRKWEEWKETMQNSSLNEEFLKRKFAQEHPYMNFNSSFGGWSKYFFNYDQDDVNTRARERYIEKDIFIANFKKNFARKFLGTLVNSKTIFQMRAFVKSYANGYKIKFGEKSEYLENFDPSKQFFKWDPDPSFRASSDWSKKLVDIILINEGFASQIITAEEGSPFDLALQCITLNSGWTMFSSNVRWDSLDTVAIFSSLKTAFNYISEYLRSGSVVRIIKEILDVKKPTLFFEDFKDEYQITTNKN